MVNEGKLTSEIGPTSTGVRYYHGWEVIPQNSFEHLMASKHVIFGGFSQISEGN